MRNLIVSVDYEIFGNGSGDVRRHILEPTERMARICERYGFPLTIFFEAEEYVGFERHKSALRAALGFDPARLIREQVASLVRRGHEFQLHLHPQWHCAKFEAGRWILRPDLETVDHLFESAEETSFYIAERKKLLESLTSAGENSVIAYRAGAFSARPGRKLLHALAHNRILFDSSVVRGLLREAAHYTLDYRPANSPKRMWRVRADVTQEDPEGLVWEVPIYSTTRRRFQQLTPSRLRAKFSRNVPPGQRSAMIKRFADPRRPTGVIKSFFERVPIKLDYHNQSAMTLYRTIKAAEWNPGLGPLDVLVAIGHTKEHIDDRPLAKLLKLVSEDPEIEIGNFSSIAAALCPPVPVPQRPVCHGKTGRT